MISEVSGWSAWELAYQSRSGPPHQPWLEPDIRDVLTDLARGGRVTDVVIVPVGFVSDHMEVLYDLDVEAKQHADHLGLNVVRAQTAGTHPRFVRMIRQLVVERMACNTARERPALGRLGPAHDVCPVDCCRPGRPLPDPPD